MSGLTEVTEATMISAHKAGMEYWKRNRCDATEEGLASLARSKGWHGGDCYAFVAGFFGAKARDERQMDDKPAAGRPRLDFVNCRGE